MNNVGRTRAFFMATSLLSYSVAVTAAESISPAGPIGGTDIRSALLPPPGNYVAGVAGGINIDSWYEGNSNSITADGHVYFAGGGLLHVYDEQFLNGTLGSTLYLGVQRTCFGIGDVTCTSGMQDVYSDVLAWSKFVPSIHFKAGDMIPYGNAFWVGLGINLPTGNYDKNRALNVGSNFYTISPNIGITHTTRSLLPAGLGEATELSARMFFNYYTENRDTDYHSGYVISMDFAATQRTGPWQYGVTGTMYRQLTDDTLNNEDTGNHGNRAASFNVGPLLAYDFMIDEKPYSLMAKYLDTAWGENTTGVKGLTLRLATTF